MIGELVDIDEHVPWDPAGITVPVVSMRGSEGRPHHRGSSDHLHDVLADCPVVTIEGARHFGPNTHPDAVAAVLVELVSRAATRR
jgi:pimeloyl-ACP methyl ester carboxylesterase